MSTTSNVIVDEEVGILHTEEGHPGYGVSNYRSPGMEETYNMKIKCRSHPSMQDEELIGTPERRCSYTGIWVEQCVLMRLHPPKLGR